MTVVLSPSIAAALAAGVLSSALFGQGSPESRPAAGRLVFQELQHDFGRIHDTRPVEWKFVFTNGAPVPVTIQEVRTSCGCTTTVLTKKTYAPGESGEITASFDPVNRQGKEKKTIKVATDEAGAREIELAILVDIIPRIGVDPPAMFLGELRFDSIAPTNLKRPLTITSRVPGFVIKSATIDDARFVLVSLPPVDAEAEGGKSTRFAFEVSLSGNLPIGHHQTALRIATNDTQRPEIIVSVIVDSIGDLRVAPSPVVLQMADGGVPVEQVVTVSARNNKPFHILEAAATSPQMTFTTAVEPLVRGSETAWRVSLRGTSPPDGTTITGAVKLKTDVPTQPEIVVPITGYVLRPSQKH